jgi:hypothetical protein
MARTPGRLVLAGTLGFVLTIAACGGNLLGPQNQLEVTNGTDSFQLQAIALDNISQTLSYTWQNTGTSANVDQSGIVASGAATLTITDAAGTEVYRRSLIQTGSFITSAGTSGSWTIEVSLSGVTGALNFRVQKP